MFTSSAQEHDMQADVTPFTDPKSQAVACPWPHTLVSNAACLTPHYRNSHCVIYGT